ncbi:SRPBCC family protein [Streptomyces sp. NRRL S-350]|uniref:SRPBCC family protein n=1 Tax=Streptomyces sp. NRRL S-350 TaxID=1463902 RepID=UPI00068EFFA9|nr:SRPBCC family protein [Streptomyces sp. NRRL S-350]
MHAIHHTDQTLLPHPPAAVWDAIIDELNGKTTWWHPHNTHQPGPTPPDQPNGTTLTTVHPNGIGKPGPKLRFTSTTTDITPHRTLTQTHTGHFQGTTTYTLTPHHDGSHTLLSITFASTPRHWPKLLHKLTNLTSKHTAATQNALANLHHHLGTAK